MFAQVPVILSEFLFKCVKVDELELILSTFKNKCNKGDLLTTAVWKDAFRDIWYFFVKIINAVPLERQYTGILTSINGSSYTKNKKSACNWFGAGLTLSLDSKAT